MAEFKAVAPETLKDNPFTLIGGDWMLVTAGDGQKFNTMTASWGGLGFLWNRNVAFSFIRPQRYTFEFMEKNDYYTLSFYPKDMKPALGLCGARSGRDCDKVKLAGLTPVFDEAAPYFEQARLVLVCKKLYGQMMTPESFLTDETAAMYKDGDYHKVYVGEIVKALIKE